MHVVLNSDVLRGNYVHHGIPAAIRRLIDACLERGHIFVIPRTALLEVERAQKDEQRKAIKEIRSAYSTLDRHNIAHDDGEPEDLVVAPNITELFSDACPNLMIANATLEEFQDAHDRACMHAVPHPPESKSDEMRDLVIWAIARRFAQDNGRALLVSADALHWHHRGDAEAADIGLVRVKSVDDALGYLEVETPGGALLRELVVPSWTLLRGAGLPIGPTESIRAMRDVQFVQGSNGPAEASGKVTIQGLEGIMLACEVKIILEPSDRRGLTLSGIEVDDKRLEPVSVDALYSYDSADDTEERLASLNDLFRNGG